MATDDDDDRKGKDSKEISKQSKGKQRQMHRPFEWRIVSLLAVLPVLCYVMGRRRLFFIGTVVQVSVKQPPAAHAVEQELGTRASGKGRLVVGWEAPPLSVLRQLRDRLPGAAAACAPLRTR